MTTRTNPRKPPRAGAVKAPRVSNQNANPNPPLTGGPGGGPPLDPELEARVSALVRAVEAEDGRELTPEWVLVADQAKRRGYIREHALRLFLTDLGRQWLRTNEAPGESAATYTMTKISKASLVDLKTLSHETGVHMQDAIGLILGAIHDNRDALRRYARRHGSEHPWEAIGHLLKLTKD
jgi:hypothetical protein